MSVNLFDPQEGINSTNIYNGTPKYEDMFLFVELMAERRGRTVLETNGLGKTSIIKTGLDKTIRINMLGQNQNPDSTNNNHFTTNWYQGSVPDNKIQYEGFGISSIKIVISSSYVPQVNIEFVDVRGITFFERNDSPYRMLFDFPPPIFYLTVKGYYGRSTTYLLHLVKNNTKYEASSGNFLISSEFVGMTFAPLADTLLKYIVNFGILNADVNNPTLEVTDNKPNINKDTVPKTTYALIIKLKNLYDNLQKLVNATDESKDYETAVQTNQQYSGFFGLVLSFASYKGIPEDYKSNDKGKLRIYNAVNSTMSETTLDQYNSKIKEMNFVASTTKIDDRLMVSFKIYTGEKDKAPILVGNGIPSTGIPVSGDLSNVLNPAFLLFTPVNNFKTALINEAKKIGVDNVNINPPNPYQLPPIEQTPTGGDTSIIVDVYYVLDITDLYFTVYRKQAETNRNLKTAQEALLNKVNAIVFDELKIQPTVYNIFKILCDDVDFFFQRLRETVIAAERHHATYKSLILQQSSGTYADNTEKVFAFPLCIKKDSNTRTYPKYISDTLPEQFPELELVNEFIQSFLQEKKDELIRSLRTQGDASGNNKWIPVSPIDSSFGGVQSNSPYYDIDPDGTGVNIRLGNIQQQVYDILIRRFYILSQFTYNENNAFNTEILSFFAKSEALNLANSVSNEDFVNLLKEEAIKYKNNIPSFYNYLNSSLPELYNLTNDNTKILLEERSISDDSIYVYRNKGNSGFKGVESVSNSLVTIRSDGTDTISVFLQDRTNSVFKNFLAKIYEPSAQIVPQMTKENIFYIPDTIITDVKAYKSRYLTDFRYTTDNLFTDAVIISKDFDPLIGLTEGNLGIVSNGVISNIGSVNSSDSFIDIWSNIMTTLGSDLISLFESAKTNVLYAKLVSLLYSSNFGGTLSPFSYIRSLISKVFNVPAVIVIPYYEAVYIGAIVEMINNVDFYNLAVNFFTTGTGSKTYSKGILIFADYHDVLNYLSVNDKKIFNDIYKDFLENQFNSINQNVTVMYDNVRTGIVSDYETALSNQFLDTITLKLTVQNNAPFTIINYSNITFNNQYPITSSPTPTFTPLSVNVNNANINSYFQQFFVNLETQMNNRNELLTNLEKDFKKSTGDEDIWTQTYYSLKNIADRWISGFDTEIKGYPFNAFENNGEMKLINKFAFVDRAMNPVGDMIINPLALVDKADTDYDVNVFTIMSEILSGNGFEFFPLSNFLKFQETEWVDIFKPATNLDQESNTAFVAMFIGGTSSYPNNLANGFINDGIENMEIDPTLNVEPKDVVVIKDNQTNTNTSFPWGQPLAFRVRFGEQNQSIFNDIQIDTKEYPETNESLQILSKIAGDNKQQAPIPKGQNLYNVYENRSYKAQVSMLGDTMIQPTQYFQLENVPMFSGAYMILGVEHNITPNFMTTSFSGVKILKYPVPIITSAATVFGIDAGDTSITSSSESVSDTITPQFNADDAMETNQTLGMNTLLI
jgi:hypothetical protein